MAVKLSKGERVTLDSSMKMALVDLGWDTQKYDGNEDFDLDVSVFLVGPGGITMRDEDFIFYGNLHSRNDAVVHQGDNRVGGGEGENIIIDFTKMPSDVEKLAICVTIDEAEAKRQNFGQVSNAYIRITKIANEFDTVGEDQIRFDLDEEFSIETAIVVCEIYKYNGDWKFNAIGAGYQGGLAALVRNYGLEVE